MPSQLIPIFRLARRAKPYEVFSLKFNDFLDFKQFSETLRLRTIRVDDEGNPFKWTDMFEFMVTKKDDFKLFFKVDHLDKNYRVMSLKRQIAAFKNTSINQLNKEPRPISSEKYNNLMALCAGDTPVISLPEHVQFYKNLPHTTA